MKPSPPLLVRIVPRAAVFSRPHPHVTLPTTTSNPTTASTPHAHPQPTQFSRHKSPKIRIVRAPPSHAELKKRQQSLIDVMMARQKEGVAEGTWPANLRIEPIVTSKTLEGLKPGAKGRLRGLLKER